MTIATKTTSSRPRRKAWVSPLVRRLGAGAAELAGANNVDSEGVS
jgi:hypothetical protein